MKAKIKEALLPYMVRLGSLHRDLIKKCGAKVGGDAEFVRQAIVFYSKHLLKK